MGTGSGPTPWPACRASSVGDERGSRPALRRRAAYTVAAAVAALAGLVDVRRDGTPVAVHWKGRRLRPHTFGQLLRRRATPFAPSNPDGEP